MGLRINNNIAALNSYNNVSRTDKAVSSSLEKLSSGFRINKAADDAAGLVISEGLRTQIGGLQVASRSAQDGVNVAQTADGALGTATTILQRMRDLSLQAKNDTNNDTSRAAIKTELDSLSSELTRISTSTSFNGVNLLDGTFKDKAFQVGYKAADQITATFGVTSKAAAATKATFVGTDSLKADYSTTNKTFTIGGEDVVLDTDLSGANPAAIKTAIETAIAANTALTAADYEVSVDADSKVTIKNAAAGATALAVTGLNGATTAGKAEVVAGVTTGFGADALGVDTSDLAVDSAANVSLTIDKIEAALTNVSSARAEIGALQNRFEYVISNLSVSIENITASESAIRDTDMAAEMTKFTKNQILSQAGTSMLAQANSSTQNILTLLRG